jgi:hypothetical protein
MPHDPHLAEQMRLALHSRAGGRLKEDVRWLLRMLHGNMLCGVEVGRYMFRGGKEQEGFALSRPGAKPMDITGRPMHGSVWVDAKEASGDRLGDWIDMATRHVAALASK